jgi:hypothetical protein
VDEALATGNTRAEIIAQNVLGEIAYLRGEFLGVKLHGERVYELAHRIGATLFEVFGAFSRGRCQSSEDGDSAAAFASFLEAYEISQATAESFMGPWVLGSAAKAAGRDEDRDWSLREGERILDAGAVSHNYFFFYINAMDARLDVEDWDEVRRYAAALENYTVKEPLEWSDFFIERGRALANFGLGKRDQSTIDDLKDLRDVASRVGYKSALPPIEAALADAGE